MDSRVYFHQYRRPRYSNPTYLSSNVRNSITFFNDGSSYYPQSKTNQESYQPIRAETNYNKVQNRANTPVKSYQPAYQPERNNEVRQYAPRQESSKLSNYGQKSIQMDQRGVYHKQTSPYNIISLKPKEFSDDIRQYPRFSIEDRDDVYYRRMNQAYNDKEYYGQRARTYEKPQGQANPIAGRHTYDLEPKMSLDPQKRKERQRFTSKMLNHMDELHHNLA